MTLHLSITEIQHINNATTHILFL